MAETTLINARSHVTANKHGERNPALTDAHYRRLFETSQDGLLIVNGSTGVIVHVNPFLVSFLGYAYEEYVQKRIWETEVFREKDEIHTAYEFMKTNEYVRYDSVHLKTKDGREVEAEFVASVFTVGDESYLQCGLRDISVRRAAERRLHQREKLLEQQLLQAQQMESLGTLAGGVAFEFNNVLAMILPSAEMIAASAELKSKSAVYVSRIIDAANRGANVARQLLIFARAEKAEFKPISLQRIVLEIASLLEHKFSRDVKVRTEIVAAQSMIMGENALLHQAVLNLALNACEAMTDGGVITIRLDDALEDEMRTQFPESDEGAYLALRVQDTGKGIDEKTRRRIFDPFFTTKEPGSGLGLGLSIVHSIVNSHGGYIDVQTRPGEGTTVSLYFPLLKHYETSSLTRVEKKDAVRGTETILVVEDEESIRETVSELLTHQGYTVLTAADGVEGLEQVQAHKDEIGLVLSDLGMPRMNGEQFFTAARKLKPSLKIIITTGYLHSVTKSKLLSLGVTDMIAKPFSTETLLPAVRRALDKE
ncbi:MAG TPA: ATP-binding protein [Bacteroidota bacterium]|nr:ATP-binding protein [Bacteroidota bacterium]